MRFGHAKIKRLREYEVVWVEATEPVEPQTFPPRLVIPADARHPAMPHVEGEGRKPWDLHYGPPDLWAGRRR